MIGVRTWAALASVGLIATAAGVAGGVPAASASNSSRTQLAGSLTPAIERAHPAGSVPADAKVSFDMSLALQNASAAQAEVKAVSNPGSASYRHFLTDAEWSSRYGPTVASLQSTESWLRSQGFTVGKVAPERLMVGAEGTAAQVEKAFSTTLGYYKVNGETVRLANSSLSIPSSLTGSIAGVVGVNEYLATNDLTTQLSSASTSTAQPNQEPPPPAGFRNPQPCSGYWGEKTDTADASSLYAPYTSPMSYDICGYHPGQLRNAYSVATGPNGSGVGIAIVDAYDSPTLLSDAQTYSSLNDATHPLNASQFINVEPATVDDEAECGASGWYPEQALDVESSHAMAPGATILFVGAQDCTDAGLLAALQTAITSGVSVVSDSWGDTLGDLLSDQATKTSFDNTFMLADSTGVSVLFSSGDSGDNFADFGIAAPDYPPSSPFITAVGGTSLEVNAAAKRAAEFGWSTGKQILCSSATTNCGTATAPTGNMAFNAGGGGGTSYNYTEPYYQIPVVPPDLALRNEALFGPVPLRVVPDISMDADAQTGFLIGLTQTFPNGTYYSQFKEGGTSLASPLLAGVIADTDQAAGGPLGFLNPTLYKADGSSLTAFKDIVPPASPDAAAVVRVDYANTTDASDGYVVSLRVLDYEGPETYCDGTGNCATRDVTLTTAPGYDSMTGIGSVGTTFIATLSKF